MKRIINKIVRYKKEHSLIETISWLWNCFIFKLRKLKPVSGNYLKTKLSKNEKNTVVLKSNSKVFIFANVPYYDIGGGQRSSQLAKTFNKMGYPVYYIHGFKSNESKIHTLNMPMIMHSYIDNVKLSYLEGILDENDLCIFEAPCEKYYKYVELAINKKAKIVYENIDNWETSLGKGVLDKETLNLLLKNSDLLVGTAKPLVDQLKGYCKELNISKDVMYLANAVDDELFFPMKNFEKPEDLVVGKKTLIYYGSLWGEWFDWDLIFGIAKKHPDYVINLIGDYKVIPEIVKESPENVKYLGIKKQIELPNYLKYCDYALLPFKVGEISDYVSPLKLFEYISMNKIVLSTSLPDIVGYPNTYFGDTVDEWDKILKKNYSVDEEASQKFICENSWNSRVADMIDFLYKNDKCSKEYYDNISIIILNYNNKNIIDRCVDSLLYFNNRYSYEIIVVDNNSTDGSYEQLESKYKGKIKLIKNKKNGCSSGRNLGVKYSTKKYLMFLDSDQWAMNNYWIDPYFEVINNADNVGLIGWAAGFFNKFGKAYHVVDSFPNRYMPRSGLCRYDIGYLGSGGMFLEKTTFDKIDGFDEYYDPTCYEDTDISLKVRNLGKEIYYCPFLGVMHLPHQTTKSGSDNHRKLMEQKQKYFTDKWTKENASLLKKYIK